jgi:integrase
MNVYCILIRHSNTEERRMAKYKSTNKVGVYTYHGKKGICFWINFRYKKLLEWERIGWNYEGYTATMASQIRGDRLRKILHGEELNIRERELTLDEGFRIYFKQVTPKAKLRDLCRYNKHLQPYIGEKLLSIITPLVIEELKDKWAYLAAGSQKHNLSLLGRIYNTLYRFSKYNGDNPCKKVKPIKVNNNSLRYLTQQEAKKLMAKLQEGRHDLYVQSLIALLTGLRKSEILQLTTRDIDLESNLIIVREVKDSSSKGRTREQYIPPILRGLLKDYTTESGSKLFKTFRTRSFNSAVKELKLNKGVEDRRDRFSFHTLRHTYATWLAKNGESLQSIQKKLGHKSIVMTERYAKYIKTNEQETADKLADTLLG